MTPRLKRVEVVHDYVVRLWYGDGVTANVDLSYVVELGPIFEALGQPDIFERVQASRAANTVTWPNGADIAPETLYKLARQAAAITS